jgi:hypothetical protein
MGRQAGPPSSHGVSARVGWMKQFRLAEALPTYAQDERQPDHSIALWFTVEIIIAVSDPQAWMKPVVSSSRSTTSYRVSGL